jgi:CO dehydrogenase maturation factor
VRHLVLQRDEVVVLDMEAGIEHLGRGTAMGVDLILVVVEPGKRSIETAHRIRGMAAALGIRRFAVVLNKASAPRDQAWVEAEFGSDQVLGVIPFDPRIADADRQGVSLMDLGLEELLQPFRAIRERLQVPCTADEGGLR